MALTPEQIKAARAQYGIKTDPTVLDMSVSGQEKSKPEMSGSELTAFLTDGKVAKKKTSMFSPEEGEDNIFTRGKKAIVEAAKGLKESFTKRADTIIDTTVKTGEDYNIDVKPEDVMRAFKGEFKGNPAVSQLLAPLKNALNMVGQTGGAVGDILAETVKAGYKTLTPEATQQKLAEGVTSILQTPTGQAGLSKLGEGLESYNKWKAENPDGAQAIENVINVAGLFGGKAAEEIAVPLAKKGAENTIDFAKQGIETAAKKINANFDKLDEVAKKRALLSAEEKAYEAISPSTTELTPTEYKELLAKKKILPKTKTQPASYVLSKEEKEIAKKYAPLLQSNDPVENSIAVMEDIARKDAEVGVFLRENNNIFNDGELKNFLTKEMKDITDITVDDDKLDAKKLQMIENFIAGLPKNNMEELWMNRKAFDQYIEKAFSGSPTLTKELKKGLRNGVQDFIAARTPEGVYKQSMKDMRQLFDIEDVVSTRAVKERGDSGIQKWIKDNPTKVKLIGGGAGLIGVGGLWNYVSQ